MKMYLSKVHNMQSFFSEVLYHENPQGGQREGRLPSPNAAYREQGSRGKQRAHLESDTPLDIRLDLKIGHNRGGLRLEKETYRLPAKWNIAFEKEVNGLVENEG